LSEDSIRILIVDDSALYRLLLRDVLGSIPGCAVVGNAKNGKEALQRIDELDPHLVTLDVEMPGMSGIDVLRAMNDRRCRTKALMVSRFTDAGAQTTADALPEGALDFLLKPSGKDPSANKASLRRELEEKLAAYREGSPTSSSTGAESSVATAVSTPSWNCAAVFIGASTGGPEALRLLLPKLPGDFPVPVVVVQHMPPQFTHPLAKRLNDLSALEVVEAEHGMPLVSGKVLVAPGGRHLKLTGHNDQVAIQITDDPPEHNCRPAVDYTLRSACDSLQGRALAVILTGMGRDGLQGSDALKQRGGRVVAQHVDGCTVFGMPKAVIEAGLADRIVRLPHLSAVVCEEVKRGYQGND
jgi:two-component system chemotaxis response regulator CheB